MKYFTLLILIKCYALTVFANSIIIHGTVKDKQTGEAIVGVAVYNTVTQDVVYTNNYGFYSLKIANICANVNYSHLGYNTDKRNFCTSNDTLVNIWIEPVATEISEVIVTTKYDKVSNPGTGIVSLSPAKIKTITSMTGSADVLKSLQLLPGVQTANEGSTNLNIRGGSFDQNLILLDEAPVYNPSHALGFFSTFNADAIKSVTMYKGCYPARYGGRLSSVIDLNMKEGNNRTFTTNADIGIASSQFTTEGPIIKDKSSFLLSARYCYVGSVLKTLTIFPFMPMSLSGKEKINFYDLNLKVNYIFNENNRLYISNYSGNDNFSSNVISGNNQLNWGNRTMTLRWNHIYSSKLFSNLTSYYSRYNYTNFNNADSKEFEWHSGITEIGVKDDFSFYERPGSIWKFGLSLINRAFEPGSIKPRKGTSVSGTFSLQTLHNNEIATYIENEYSIASKLTIQTGLRFSGFANMGPHIQYHTNPFTNVITDSVVTPSGSISKFYYSIEPRITARYLINEDNSVKIGYAYTVQNMHMLSNSSVGMPYDVWLPANDIVKPQSANQFVIGYYSNVNNKSIVISSEVYYKLMSNIIDFKDNANLVLNKNIESEILSGNGKSYGIETMIEKPFGKLNGWIGYTLSKTQYKINGINNNNWFSPRYDIRHNITIVGFYECSKRWSLSSTFKFTSGGFITFPERSFRYDNATFPQYTSRNNFRLPAYHRLDISAVYKGKRNENRNWKSEWAFSLYNVYGHKNIFALFVRQNIDYRSNSQTYFMYLFGVVPTVSYKISF